MEREADRAAQMATQSPWSGCAYDLRPLCAALQYHTHIFYIHCVHLSVSRPIIPNKCNRFWYSNVLFGNIWAILRERSSKICFETRSKCSSGKKVIPYLRATDDIYKREWAITGTKVCVFMWTKRSEFPRTIREQLWRRYEFTTSSRWRFIIRF